MSAFNDVAAAQAEVRYSQVWEDHELLSRALAIGPGHRVLSIGSAGDNVLALLLAEPRRIVAVDVSPAQAALLELKLAAIRELEPDAVAAFLGARESPERLATYDALTLTDGARRYWDRHRGAVESGVLRCGMLDRYILAFGERYVSRLVAPDAIRRFLELDDLDQQRTLFEAEFRALEPAVLAWFGRDGLLGRARDASQFEYVGPVDVGASFWRRFETVCTTLPARGNFYLEWLLTGSYRDLELGPPHLRPANVERLRPMVDRIELVRDDLASYLWQNPEPRFDAANLSDLFEYLSPEDSAELLSLIAARMRPDGRIAYWNLFVDRSVADAGETPLRPDTDLARWLFTRDRVPFYNGFHVEVAGRSAAYRPYQRSSR